MSLCPLCVVSAKISNQYHKNIKQPLLTTGYLLSRKCLKELRSERIELGLGIYPVCVSHVRAWMWTHTHTSTHAQDLALEVSSYRSCLTVSGLETKAGCAVSLTPQLFSITEDADEHCSNLCWWNRPTPPCLSFSENDSCLSITVGYSALALLAWAKRSKNEHGRASFSDFQIWDWW